MGIKSKKQIADVSVVVANYNQAAFLPQFLQSIIDSTYHPSELLIVDDASTDKSIEILKRFASNSWLKIIQLKNNVGYVNALNVGILQVKGNYILRVDPDDYISPMRIEKQYAYLQAHPDVDVIGSNVIYVSSEGRPIFKSRVPTSPKTIVKSLLNGSLPIFHGSVMGKASVFKDNLYRPHIIKAQDYDFFCRIMKKGHTLANSAEYLSYYRMHSNNASNNDLLATCQTYYNIREELFSIAVPGKLYIYLKYFQMFLYRRSLACHSKMCFSIHIFFSLLLQPSKLIHRIKNRYFG